MVAALLARGHESDPGLKAAMPLASGELRGQEGAGLVSCTRSERGPSAPTSDGKTIVRLGNMLTFAHSRAGREVE